MNYVGEIRLHTVTVELLADGLTPKLGRALTGLAQSRLKRLTRDICGHEPEELPGPPRAGTTRLSRLGGILHASAFMGCLDSVSRASGALSKLQTRHDAALFHAAWVSYRRILELGTLPFPDDVLDVNAACALFLDRKKLQCQFCGSCRSRVWRAEIARSPRACPMCLVGRRFGIEREIAVPFLVAARLRPPARPARAKAAPLSLFADTAAGA